MANLYGIVPTLSCKLWYSVGQGPSVVSLHSHKLEVQVSPNFIISALHHSKKKQTKQKSLACQQWLLSFICLTDSSIGTSSPTNYLLFRSISREYN